MNEIETKNLTLTDIPRDTGDLERLRDFTYTISGYSTAGSFECCAEIAQSPDQDSIEELRIALFFNFRAIRHSGESLTEEWISQMYEIVARIRLLVEERDK